MINLIVLCGAPGSGKTTISKKISEEQNLIRLSMDELRFLSHSELLPLLVDLLNAKKSVVVDALYTKFKWRQEILEATKEFVCKRTLIYVDIPLDECIRRNAERENELPDFVIENIYNSIDKPTLDEGWDEILYY
jgi:tRNA uridine 5-carbamoylmethylation protein Kti12